MDILYEAIIVGAGPAGLTAALYTTRARLRTLIIDKETIGGELMNRDLIENYPGYPEGISGPELGSHMMRQVMTYSPEIQLGEVEGIQIKGDYKLVKTVQGQYRGKAVIIAGGAHPKKLRIPGEEEFTDRGVFYCAACDGPHFTDKVVAVAGGGDSGITEALSLSRIASRVIVIEILPHLNATKVLQERAALDPKIEIKCGFKIEAIRGNEHVRALELVEVETGQKSVLEVEGLLAYIGLEANTDYLKGTLLLTETGQIVVNENLETEIPGIFAAGDIRHNSPMQIAAAVGDGAAAALSLMRYLETTRYDENAHRYFQKQAQIEAENIGYGYDVVWPLGRATVTPVSGAPRLTTLEGKTVCELSNYSYDPDRSFPVIEELLKKQSPNIKFINYEVFGNTHGKKEKEVIEALPGKLTEYGCDAVISGNGG